MDRERNEDLNPHGDDIEEKVRRMLDPSVSDEQAKDPAKPKPVASKSKEQSSPPSAPTVPSKPSKMVVIPITHHDEPQPAVSEQSPAPKSAVAPPVKKITINEHAESPTDVAEKLDAAIAELDTPPKKAAEEKLTQQSEPEPLPENKSSQIDKNGVLKSVNEIPTAPVVVAAAENTDMPVPQASTPETEIGTTVPSEAAVDPQVETPGDLPITVGEAMDKAATEATAIKDPAVLTDPETEKAVDAIIASESDEILEIEDAVRDTDETVEPKEKTKKHGPSLKTILKSRAFRWIALLLVLGGLLAAGGVPKSRYLILNTAGVRAVSSLTVLDDSTQQPLKNVQVSIGDATGTTNANGEVKLTKVKLGPNLLSIQKRAFAPITKTVVIGWGSNPLPSYNLTPTGTQYEFTTIDYLSGKPLEKVEASSNDADARSNDQGIIKLTLDKPADDTEIKVTFKLTDYRDETTTFNPNDKSNHTIKMVPAHKQLFVSKRSGKYDVYSISIDGKEEKVILAGTGSERDDMVLVPHPTEPVAAYVSTRGNQHNNQNFLLSELTIINTDDNTATNVVASERIQIVDWSGDHLVYVQIASGESASSPKRYRLMSYDLKSGTTKELASSNYFNDVVSVSGDIYYAPSSAYQSNKTALYKIKADGSGAQTVFNQEVWNIIRTSYDHLALSVEQQWYDYRVGNKAPEKINAAPSSQVPRIYMNSPDGTHSAWVDVRDGKGVLLIYDTSTKSDVVLQSQSGLTYPVNWLSDNVLVYRVKNDHETADYAISTAGGASVKIRDVTNVGGIDHWYYY